MTYDTRVVNIVKKKNTQHMEKIITDIDKNLFGKQLRELRLSLGFPTAKAFSKRLGLLDSTYHNYEHGRLPPVEVLYLIQKEFDEINIQSIFDVLIKPQYKDKTKLKKDKPKK